MRFNSLTAINPRFNPKTIPQNIGWYLAGFADGEGSFYVTFRYRKDYTWKWKVTAVFNVANKDRVMIPLFKKQLKCGTVRDLGNQKYLYEVDTLHALQHVVIPFFKEYRFFSAKKKKEFAIFQKIVGILLITPRTFSQIKQLLILRKQLGADRTNLFKNLDPIVLEVIQLELCSSKGKKL